MGYYLARYHQPPRGAVDGPFGLVRSGRTEDDARADPRFVWHTYETPHSGPYTTAWYTERPHGAAALTASGGYART